MYSYGPPHMAEQKQDDQLEHTYSSYVRIRDVALKTYRRRWTIGRGGERGSGISVLTARHDDDDDTHTHIYIYIYIYIYELLRSSVSYDGRIYWLLFCRGVRPHFNVCCGFNTQQSDGEAPVTFELKWMWSSSWLSQFHSGPKCYSLIGSYLWVK